MKRLIIAAVGLALVVGIVVGGMVANPFGRSAPASAAGVGGRIISLGTLTAVPTSAVVDYPMVDVQDCAEITVMAQGSTDGIFGWAPWYISPDGTKRITGSVWTNSVQGNVDGLLTASATVEGRYEYIQPRVQNGVVDVQDITLWLWCATSPSYAVGGIAELPPLASVPGGSGVSGTTYAVLAGAAAGVLAFAVLATLSVKRRRV
jgi:hypothetical protein